MNIVKKRTRYIVGPSADPNGLPWKLTCKADADSLDGDLRAAFATQKGAIAAAVTLCHSRLRNFGQLSELQIKGRNGKIRDSRTYGRDPRKVKG